MSTAGQSKWLRVGGRLRISQKVGIWDETKDWKGTSHETICKRRGQKGKPDQSNQYSAITYMGKESEKEWIYVYV